MEPSKGSWVRWANSVETLHFLAWLDEEQDRKLKSAMAKACGGLSTQEDLLRAKTLEDIKQHIAESQQ